MKNIYFSVKNNDLFLGEDDRVLVLARSEIRERPAMEDTFVVSTNLPGNVSFVGVFDGHSGSGVARFCAKYMCSYILRSKEYREGKYRLCLSNVFMQMDRLMRSRRGVEELDKLEKQDASEIQPPTNMELDQLQEELGVGCVLTRQTPLDGPGTTATVALVTDYKIFVASVGDSYCLLFREEDVEELTKDHHWDYPGEITRVLKAGGTLVRDSCGGSGSYDSYVTIKGRTNGAVGNTRALGDIQFKLNDKLRQEEQAVVAVPDVVDVDIDAGCEYIAICSDGIDKSEFRYETFDVAVTKLMQGLPYCNGDNATMLLVGFK